MPILAGLLQSLFGGLVAWLAQFVTRKVAIATVAVGAFGAAITALLLAFNSVVAPLAAQLFSTDLGQFVGLAFPPVAGNCLVALGTTWSACALYSWQKKAIELAATAG